MTPFEEFRRWLRQGRTSEKAVSAVAAVVAFALVMWTLIPTGDGTEAEQEVVAGASVQPGAQAASGTTGTAVDPITGAPISSVAGSSGALGGSAVGAASGGAATTGSTPAQSAASACPASGPRGITSKTILLAITNPDLGPLNELINIPSPEQQIAMNKAMVDWANKNGGVACRQIAIKQYADNPIDANAERALCLQIVQDKPFVNLGGLYTPENADCLPQNKIPQYELTGISSERLVKYRQYLFSYYNSTDRSFRDYVYGARAVGWFQGLKRIGVFHGNCNPNLAPQLFAVLAEAGYPKGSYSTYDIGCPASIEAARGPTLQAVLKFKGDGVTHVMSGGTPLHQFATTADQQDYHPKYAVSDADETIFISDGSAAPDAVFDGALAITGSKYGGYNSGIDPGPLTAVCDGIMKAAGLPTTREKNAYAGGVCNTWFLFLESAKRVTGTLVPEALAGALDTLGVIDLSYPGGKANFTKPGTNYATGYWREARYNGACKCWKIPNAAWQNGF